MGPQFGETAYISGANRARKVKSDAQVTRTRIPCRNCFLRGGWGRRCPNSIFSKHPELSETSRVKKLIFGLQVNIDKANSRRYDVTHQMVYRGSSKDPQSAHQCTVSCEVQLCSNVLSWIKLTWVWSILCLMRLVRVSKQRDKKT